MDCPKCRNYYPDDEPLCPYCGFSVSKKEKKLAVQEKRRKFWECEKDLRTRRETKTDCRPISAVLLEIQTVHRKSTLGTITRGLFGGLLFGAFGTAVGMATAKGRVRQVAHFAVTYADGRCVTEAVEVGSTRYAELIRFCFE